MPGRTIRTLGAGLALSAVLMKHYFIPFVQNYATDQASYAYLLALHVSAGSTVAHALGLDVFVPAIFIMACLGAGLLIAGSLYPSCEAAIEGGMRFLGLSLSRALDLEGILPSSRISLGGGQTRCRSAAVEP